MSSTPPSTSSLVAIALTLALAGAAAVQITLGYASLLLFLAAAVLCLCIALMWSSLQRIGQREQMTFEEALSFSAPTATEEQKRAVLRTLKDLEYELHVGKISREDFDEVSAEVRKKAKVLIAQQDEDIGDRLKKAEARIEKYRKSQKNSGKKTISKTQMQQANQATDLSSEDEKPTDSSDQLANTTETESSKTQQSSNADESKPASDEFGLDALNRENAQ